MEEVSGEDVYFRRTGNVSIGGAYFDTPFPYEPGTEVTLKFGLPGSREMVVARQGCKPWTRSGWPRHGREVHQHRRQRSRPYPLVYRQA